MPRRKENDMQMVPKRWNAKGFGTVGCTRISPTEVLRSVYIALRILDDVPVSPVNAHYLFPATENVHKFRR